MVCGWEYIVFVSGLCWCWLFLCFLINFRVYCEYNSLYDFAKERENSGETLSSFDDRTSFETAEDQLLHFLARAGRPRWKWMSVRPRSPLPHFSHNGAMPIGGHHDHRDHNGNNGQGSRKAEPYYCDRYLVQSLVRDAMVTDALDQPSHPLRREEKQWVNSFQLILFTIISFFWKKKNHLKIHKKILLFCFSQLKVSFLLFFFKFLSSSLSAFCFTLSNSISPIKYYFQFRFQNYSYILHINHF